MMTRKFWLFPLFLTFLMTLQSCGDENPIGEVAETGSTEAPKWYLEMPDRDEDWFYGWSEATSGQMQLSNDQARANAKARLSQKISESVDTKVKQSVASLGNLSDGTEQNINKYASQAVLKSQTTIRGAVIHKNNIFRYKDGYRSFVCLKVRKESVLDSVKDALSEENKKIQNDQDRQKLEEMLKNMDKDDFFE